MWRPPLSALAKAAGVRAGARRRFELLLSSRPAPPPALTGLDLAAGNSHSRPWRGGRALLEKDPALAVHQRRGHHRECRNFLQIGGQRKDSVNFNSII